MTTLNIGSLPAELVWNPRTRGAVSLELVAGKVKSSIFTMMESGAIAQRDSFGFALATPDIKLADVWDDPEKLIAMVAFWGPEGPRFAANACRKIRAAARENMDTETIRRDHPYLFLDSVASVEEDGTFTWGDFPYDGAAFTEVQGRRLLGAVSAFPKEEDPIIARLFTGFIGLAMYISDGGATTT